MSTRYGFYFDASRCIKCWACEIACLQWKGIKAGTIKLRKVKEITIGSFPDVSRKFISLACMHCSKAPCAGVCPTGAIHQRIEDGIVTVNKEKCIGCHECLNACPWGIPQFDDEGTMQKCDMCLDRLENNQKPICAEACPTHALSWGTLAELSEIASGRALQRLSGESLLTDKNTASDC